MLSLNEFYKIVNGDLNEVLSRLGKEERIVKYLNLFTKDDSYNSLFENIKSENYAEAFRNIHTIKGMCLNLGIESLRIVSSDLCEILRPQVKPDVDMGPYLEKIKQTYTTVINAISEL